ncbi:uncharacterized protein M421DRAFT_207841 [Didymella exigua CBS 183.55]|uniref:Secreted protein n=1 Tax=Didymella exigua CBS 183.55 TaxID=1150837 RepID=A0A6A5RGF6_9PLEO|nr:uncharacterized protein M421DRAFT_207841 [Didymella exigua CBS 183.55]KAF1926832.1 hypothetical protein M421DRAFT_207841 [Didymella exigua CBS 183.55]
MLGICARHLRSNVLSILLLGIMKHTMSHDHSSLLLHPGLVYHRPYTLGGVLESLLHFAYCLLDGSLSRMGGCMCGTSRGQGAWSGTNCLGAWWLGSAGTAATRDAGQADPSHKSTCRGTTSHKTRIKTSNSLTIPT